MHSSRMCTVCLLTVCLLWGGGVHPGGGSTGDGASRDVHRLAGVHPGRDTSTGRGASRGYTLPPGQNDRSL